MARIHKGHAESPHYEGQVKSTSSLEQTEGSQDRDREFTSPWNGHNIRDAVKNWQWDSINFKEGQEATITFVFELATPRAASTD